MTRSSLSASESKRILIVDDNKMGLSARRAVLEAVGHTVTTAMSGTEALQLFDAGSFDLVVTDFKMPKMTGVELIAELRQRAPQLPIVLISGFTDTLGLSEANTLADIVLQKNASEVGQLVRAVTKLLIRPARKPAATATSTKESSTSAKRKQAIAAAASLPHASGR